MSEDNGYTIYCSRCGAEMNSNSRYCMKCGNLNYNHEANTTMRPYIPEEKKKSYEVGSGKFVIGNENRNKVRTSIANNTGNKSFCFFINFFLYVGILLFCFYRVVSGNGFTLSVVVGSIFPILCILLSIYFLYFYSLELIYMKCNKPWWSAFVPVYQCMVLADILYNKPNLGLLSLIPIVGQIFVVVMVYQLGEKFEYNGFATILLSFIYIPLMGLGNHVFAGYNFVDTNEKNFMEKDYRYRKVFLITFGIFMVLGIGGLVFANLTDVKRGASSVKNYYYVYAANRLVSKVEKNINKGTIKCSSGYSSEWGIYYFQYADVHDVIYLPFYSLREVIKGYVRVDNSTGQSVYYVSVSDGTFGFPETVSNEIHSDSVVEYPTMPSVPNSANICQFSE